MNLYVWENEGGISRVWDVPQDVWSRGINFFVFGRYCGGYSPMGKLDANTKAKAEQAVVRAKELYGIDVKIVYGPAPAEV